MKKISLLLTCMLLTSLAAFAQHKQADAFHSQTHWDLQGSLKYDFLCLLNTLSGDPYYLKYYEPEYGQIIERFKPGPEVVQALQGLRREIKEENKGIVSAYLCLLYSATEAATLPQLREATQDTAQLKRGFRQSPYYSHNSWELFERVRPDLLRVLDFFINRGFEDYYRSTYAARVQQSIGQIKERLPAYNIIPTIEEHLGAPLPSDTITVYMLYFSQPHGIKIIGTRFLTDVHWPFATVFRNAVHEMMHPPFRPGDRRVKAIVRELQRDSLWAAAFERREAASGYNSYAGLFEEGAVQALENHLNHRFGMGRDVADYWARQDGGVHVMAVCLYVAMQEWDFSKRRNYARFLSHFRRQVRKHGGLSFYYRKMYPRQSNS
ncbi:hypothetical protein CLV24_14310 [Pontibacter ummariensis]|uniref:DUF4932 domain-containing protein n=1 Tax=Pontibacter ummariensis TaxID=1610492 RepID=A0A239LIC9_9BACT|nr:hypothetical protein [Pontibacter ummariensis]PRY03134.1 hypothetical protein CLV24_14310 [Pontibacter ummariensis]SNT30346.1 hypothetical protein SAMN06296052_14310 [Pontibacter ummariensis]